MGVTENLPDILTDPNAVLKDSVDWRHGQVPDYTAANAKYAAERSIIHSQSSLEQKVTCLVKNWEKEVSFKQHLEDFRTMAPGWWVTVNGGKKFTLTDVLEQGSYNALIGDQAFFCSSKLGFEESHRTFRRAMPTGFAWEVLDVWSGPPKVAFKWRHWGHMTGQLRCPLSNGMTILAQPTMEEHGMSGCALARLTPDFRMESLELYFDQQQPMSSMVRYSDGLNRTASSTEHATSQAAQLSTSTSAGRAAAAVSVPHKPARQSSRARGSDPGTADSPVPAPERVKSGFGKGIKGFFSSRSIQ